MNWKLSALVISEILRLFVNNFTADDKYSHRNKQNFHQPVQTELSEKGKTFCGFFIIFLKCAWNEEQFEREDGCPSLIIYEIIESERRGYLKVKSAGHHY